MLFHSWRRVGMFVCVPRGAESWTSSESMVARHGGSDVFRMFGYPVIVAVSLSIAATYFGFGLICASERSTPLL